jgi:hypothetical protein
MGTKESDIEVVEVRKTSCSVVSSEDHRMSNDRGIVNEEYRVCRRNMVLLKGIRFRWVESGFVGCVVKMA